MQLVNKTALLTMPRARADDISRIPAEAAGGHCLVLLMQKTRRWMKLPSDGSGREAPGLLPTAPAPTGAGTGTPRPAVPRGGRRGRWGGRFPQQPPVARGDFCQAKEPFLLRGVLL